MTYNLPISWLMRQSVCHIVREKVTTLCKLGSEDAENAGSENTGLENAKTI